MRALGCLSGLNRRGDLPPSRDGMGAKLAVIGGGQMFSMKMVGGYHPINSNPLRRRYPFKSAALYA